MLIKSIELENFRQYKGKQKLECSIDPKKPVTVVLAQNTGGKSTIVAALIWCLYDNKTQEDLGFSAGTPLLNEELMVELENSLPENHITKTMKVVVEVIKPAAPLENDPGKMSEEIQYTFEREVIYKRLPDDSPNKVGSTPAPLRIYERRGNGNQKQIIYKSDKDKIVNSFMPQDLSECFFFWGERMKKNTAKINVKSAVEMFTGNDIYTKALTHLKTIRGDLKELYRETSSDKEINSLAARIDNDKLEAERLRNELDSINKSIEALTKERDTEYDQYIQAQPEFQNGEALIDLNERIASLEQDLYNKQKAYKAAFNDLDFPKLIALDKAKSEIEKIDKNENSSAGWGSLTVGAIEEILNKGVCVCGARLSDHPELIEHIKKQMALAVPNAMGNYLAGVDSSMRAYKNRQFKDIGNVQSLLLELKKIRENLRDLQNQAAELNEKAQGYDEAKRHYDKYQECQAKIDQKNINKGSVDEKLNVLETAIEDEEAALANLINLRDSNNSIGLKLAITDQLIKGLDARQKERSTKVREEINDLSQKYLDEVYEGEREVVIDKGYNIKLYAKGADHKRELDTSSGLDSVKNFVFVAALLTVARKMLNNRSAGDDIQYPLMLDAPFSQTDTVHTRRICDLLARISEQTVFFMMDKDWEIAKDKLLDRVGAEYQIKKLAESRSILVKEEVSGS